MKASDAPKIYNVARVFLSSMLFLKTIYMPVHGISKVAVTEKSKSMVNVLVKLYIIAQETQFVLSKGDTVTRPANINVCGP